MDTIVRREEKAVRHADRKALKAVEAAEAAALLEAHEDALKELADELKIERQENKHAAQRRRKQEKREMQEHEAAMEKERKEQARAAILEKLENDKLRKKKTAEEKHAQRHCHKELRDKREIVAVATLVEKCKKLEQIQAEAAAHGWSTQIQDIINKEKENLKSKSQEDWDAMVSNHFLRLVADERPGSTESFKVDRDVLGESSH